MLHTLSDHSSVRLFFLLIGWSAFGYLAYKVATTESDTKVYNPFEILGLGTVCTPPDPRLLHCSLFTGYHGERDQITLQEAIQSPVRHSTSCPNGRHC